MEPVRLRTAGTGDAEAIALLHADSWRRHYRGAYADGFLDGDLVADRRDVWSARLAEPAGAETVLAEDGSALVGFVHVIFDKDARWGSLVDNLHVTNDRRHGGIGTALLARAAAVTTARAAASRMYLWVLEQNLAAQRFYRSRGGMCVERGVVPPPGGVAGRLNGSPACLRIAWPDTASLAT